MRCKNGAENTEMNSADKKKEVFTEDETTNFLWLIRVYQAEK